MPLMMLMPLPRPEAETEAPAWRSKKVVEKSKKAIYNAGANGYNIHVPILLTKEKARR